MDDFTVEPTSKEAVDHLVKKHYLRKWPGVTVCTIGLRAGGEYIGVIVFALPPRETNKRYCVSVCWELARLFIEDGTAKNAETWFMSRAIRYVQRNFPQVELLVSYADPSRGHTGTIYKAGNWIKAGRTDSERKSPRYDLKVGDKIYSRWTHVPDADLNKVIRVPRVSKFRFIYWMNGHEQRRSLKLRH